MSIPRPRSTVAPIRRKRAGAIRANSRSACPGLPNLIALPGRGGSARPRDRYAAAQDVEVAEPVVDVDVDLRLVERRNRPRAVQACPAVDRHDGLPGDRLGVVDPRDERRRVTDLRRT